ncbi:MAG: hypothetical protein ACTHNY_04595 [Solirubrobacterales bacterium]
MRSMRPRKGQVLQFDHPVWEPLENLAFEHAGEFMWMHEVELEDGTRLHAYKHWETRRYLHLDHGGRAFVFIWDESRDVDDLSEYEEVDPRWLLEVVLAKPEDRGSFLGQYVSSQYKCLRWARSATRHRISRKRIRFVIEHSFLIFHEDPPLDRPGARARRLVFLGEDPQQIPLEVMAVEVSNGNLKVIHAMELRSRYRSAYEEVRK